MEKQLKGYIPYQDKDYKRIWENAFIVVDANVILNFYRYSDTTRKELWRILETLKERLWIPYQIAFEYSKNREKVIDSVEKSLLKIKEEFDKQLRILNNKLQEVDNKDIKCKDKMLEIMNQANEEISKMLEKEQQQQKKFTDSDDVLEKVLELFDEKCGERIPDELLEEIKAEANRRAENKIPPGYKDYKKDENFGDYCIFYSLIQKAKQAQRDLIFITDDEKEDWYLKKDGISKGGRPELLHEFYLKTHQMLFICTTKTFVKGYSKFCHGGQAPEIVIEEIEDIRKKEELGDRNKELRRLNLKTSTMIRNEKSELLDRVYRMKQLLLKIMEQPKRIDELLERIENIAKYIIADIRYEQYHGRILIVIDELEKNEGREEAIYPCIRILNQIIEQIYNT